MCIHHKLRWTCLDCLICHDHGTGSKKRMKNTCIQCNKDMVKLGNVLNYKILSNGKACQHIRAKTCPDCAPSCKHGKLLDNCVSCRSCVHDIPVDLCQACGMSRHLQGFLSERYSSEDT